MLNDGGHIDLAKTWRKGSIEEMNHADRFVDRILFPDGFPNLQQLDPLRIGQPSRNSSSAIAPPSTRRALSLNAAMYCETVNDRDSKNLFELLATDDGHIAFLEIQLGLIG